jgi:integrase
MLTRGWCRSYVNHQVNRLKRLFRWAAGYELVPPSVHHGLQAVPALRRGDPGVRENGPVKPVPDAYVDAALPFMPPPVRAMVELQRLTGCRPGEVVLMRSCDLDTACRVWVYRPGSDEGPAGRHKNSHHGHARDVFIGPKAQDVLKPWLKTDLRAYLFSPAEAEAARNADRRRGRKTPMTPSQARRKPKVKRARPRRDRYDAGSYRQAVTRACDKADAAERRRLADAGTPAAEDARLVPRWHPHQLRHGFATAVRRGHGLEAAQVLLGHAQANVTELYAEADRAKAAEVIGRIG